MWSNIALQSASDALVSKIRYPIQGSKSIQASNSGARIYVRPHRKVEGNEEHDARCLPQRAEVLFLNELLKHGIRLKLLVTYFRKPVVRAQQKRMTGRTGWEMVSPQSSSRVVMTSAMRRVDQSTVLRHQFRSA